MSEFKKPNVLVINMTIVNEVYSNKNNDGIKTTTMLIL